MSATRTTATPAHADSAERSPIHVAVQMLGDPPPTHWLCGTPIRVVRHSTGYSADHDIDADLRRIECVVCADIYAREWGPLA